MSKSAGHQLFLHGLTQSAKGTCDCSLWSAAWSDSVCQRHLWLLIVISSMADRCCPDGRSYSWEAWEHFQTKRSKGNFLFCCWGGLATVVQRHSPFRRWRISRSSTRGTQEGASKRARYASNLAQNLVLEWAHFSGNFLWRLHVVNAITAGLLCDLQECTLFRLQKLSVKSGSYVGVLLPPEMCKIPYPSLFCWHAFLPKLVGLLKLALCDCLMFISQIYIHAACM